MNIECEREKTIYRHGNNDKVSYSIGLSRKDKDGNYINGYMGARFPKDANIPNKSRIKIHSAWLDFYLKDKETKPYIFINKYEIVEQVKQEEIDVPGVKTEYEDTVVLSDADLPF